MVVVFVPVNSFLWRAIVIFIILTEIDVADSTTLLISVSQSPIIFVKQILLKNFIVSTRLPIDGKILHYKN